jgi:hypothetical protein
MTHVPWFQWRGRLGLVPEKMEIPKFHWKNDPFKEGIYKNRKFLSSSSSWEARHQSEANGGYMRI